MTAPELDAVCWRYRDMHGPFLHLTLPMPGAPEAVRAVAYVGDHLADIAAARAAGVVSVSVATGSTTAEELRAAGTDVVLPDLWALPAWLDARLDKTQDERIYRP